MSALPGETHERGGPAEAYRERPWIVVTAVTWGVLAVVVTVLGLTARNVDDPWVVLYVGVGLGVVVLARSRWFHRFPPQDEQEAKTRLGIPVLVFLVGITFFIIWVNADRADAWFYAGASTCLLALSQLVSEYRLRPSSVGRSKWLAGHLVAPLVIGVAGLFSGVSGADVLATVLALFGFSVVLGLEGEREIVRERPTSPKRAGLAALLVLAGAVWLFLCDLNPVGVALVVGLLVLFVGTIVTNTDLDALAGVTLLAFGLSLTPAVAADDEVPVVEAGDEVLVAFGDSYMSGEGAGSYLPGTNNPAGNHCRRAPTAYPLVAEGPGIPESVITVACSGAKAYQVYEEPQNADEPLDGPDDGLNQAANLDRQLDAVDVDVDLVVVSVAGNDAGFGIIGPTCVAPGDCTEVMQGWLDHLAVVDQEVGRAYAAINAVLDEHTADDPDGRPHVVAVPYPRPFGEGPCGEVPLTRRERTSLNAFVGELDAVVARQAEVAGFDYLAGMETVLVDNGLALCDGGVRGLNFLGFSSVDGTLPERINPTNWIHNSFHPNPTGHRAMAGVLEAYAAQLDGEGTDEPPPTEAMADEPYRALELSTVHAGETFVHCPIDPTAAGGAVPLACDPPAWRQREIVSELLWASGGLLLIVVGGWLLWVEGTRRSRERRRRSATT
jgi:hypothetical protein